MVLLAGVGVFAFGSNIPSIGQQFRHDRPADNPAAVAQSAAEDVFLQMQTESGDAAPLDHAFQGGDQFRFLLRGTSTLRLYCFYEDYSSGKMREFPD